MELGLFRFIGEILKSPTKLGVAVVVVLLIVFALMKLLPILLGFFKDILTSRSRDQESLLSIIREELAENRENNSRRFALDERNTKALEEAVVGLRELQARTASMDHRMADAHKAMSDDLKEIKGYIAGIA